MFYRTYKSKSKSPQTRMQHPMRPSVLYLALFLAIFTIEAKRTQVKIFHKQGNEKDNVPVGPIPIRTPHGARGPLSRDRTCVASTPVELGDQAYMLDVCNYNNVTLVPTGEDDPESKRRLLGIFHGWKLDPVTLQYKYMVFDDGDLCMSGSSQRLSVHVEFIPHDNADTLYSLDGFEFDGKCTYRARLHTFISKKEMEATDSIYSPGIIDISHPSESLPQVCGAMKCQYGSLEKKLTSVSRQLEHLEQLLEENKEATLSSVKAFTMQASKDNLRSSALVLEKALALLQDVEQLHSQATDNMETAEVDVKVE